jgi:hypothetical protein
MNKILDVVLACCSFADIGPLEIFWVRDGAVVRAWRTGAVDYHAVGIIRDLLSPGALNFIFSFLTRQLLLPLGKYEYFEYMDGNGVLHCRSCDVSHIRHCYAHKIVAED